MNECVSDPMEQTTLASLCTFHEKDGGLGKSFYANKERCPLWAGAAMVQGLCTEIIFAAHLPFKAQPANMF